MKIIYYLHTFNIPFKCMYRNALLEEEKDQTVYYTY